MKKTYWWRILNSIIAGGIVVLGWIYDTYYCFSFSRSTCLFDEYRLTFIEPVVLFSVYFFIVSIFLFFINDNIFLKWFKFAMIWMVLTVTVIVISPKTSHDALFTIDKEMVSIWMSSLFAIISIIILAYQSYKLRKK